MTLWEGSVGGCQPKASSRASQTDRGQRPLWERLTRRMAKDLQWRLPYEAVLNLDKMQAWLDHAQVKGVHDP